MLMNPTIDAQSGRCNISTGNPGKTSSAARPGAPVDELVLALGRQDRQTGLGYQQEHFTSDSTRSYLRLFRSLRASRGRGEQSGYGMRCSPQR